jgi:hypothetical protein
VGRLTDVEARGRIARRSRARASRAREPLAFFAGEIGDGGCSTDPRAVLLVPAAPAGLRRAGLTAWERGSRRGREGGAEGWLLMSTTRWTWGQTKAPPAACQPEQTCLDAGAAVADARRVTGAAFT